MKFRSECLKRTPAGARDGNCLIIGEVAQSHDGSLGMAHAFVDAIAAAGADAIKFQTHIAAEESTRHEPWRVKFSRQDETRYDYWKRMEFTPEQWAGLKRHADEAGLLFMSSPFSEPAVDLLRSIGMRVWKVASGEVGNTPMLRRITERNDPVIISSGLSDWAELDSAVELVSRRGNPLAVVQCTSAYPCPPDRVGLNLLGEINRRYGLPAGLSDHSGRIFAGLAAATLGAEVIEVHVALSKEMFGPDVASSLTSEELRKLVLGVREIESILACPVDKSALAADASELRKLFTKSIVAGTDLGKGTILESKHLKLKKPGTGLPPSYLAELIGLELARDLVADEPLSMEDIVGTSGSARKW